MNNNISREKLVKLAELYCDYYGYLYMYVNNDGVNFGYEDNNGNMIEKSFAKLIDELRIKDI